MELFIVIIIVALAAGYTTKTFYNKYKAGKADGQSCGCTSCDTGPTCCDSKKNSDYLIK